MNITLPSRYDFVSRFLKLAIINVLSYIMVPLAGTISVAFLGHLTDIHYLAGVTLSTSLFSYIYSIVSFLRMGSTGVTAQAVARDDTEEMLLVGLRNGLIALGIGGLILILQYPLQQLWFAIVSATPEVKASGIDYFNARIWGAPAVVVNFVLIGWLLGREQSGKVLLMSVVGNAANIVFDYLFIVNWGWASTGAGLSQAVSQYLMLVLGAILASRDIEWTEVRTAAGKLWDTRALKATFTLNGNIFVRSLANMTVAIIFINLTSTMGTKILAETALIAQAVLLGTYCFEGIGFATETLSGNFKGKEAYERLLPLLQVVVLSSLLVGLSLAGVCVLFPQTIFGVFTDHTELIELLKIHVAWLLPLLGFSSVFLVLDGYFAGLAQGEVLRNTALVGFVLGFVPLAFAAWYFHSNHILWLSFSVFTATKVVLLGVQVPSTLKDEPAAVVGQLPDSRIG
jgi:MATE family multidrug resistance protein